MTPEMRFALLQHLTNMGHTAVNLIPVQGTTKPRKKEPDGCNSCEARAEAGEHVNALTRYLGRPTR